MLCRLSLGTEHKIEIATIQDSLRNAVKLAFPKEIHALCVNADALEVFWAAVIAQTKKEQLAKQVGEQKYDLMDFLGRRFIGAQRKWTTYEKEAYAIVHTFDRLDYLSWKATQAHMVTDHKNLLYVLLLLGLDRTHLDMYCRKSIGGQYICQDWSSSLIRLKGRIRSPPTY